MDIEIKPIYFWLAGIIAATSLIFFGVYKLVDNMPKVVTKDLIHQVVTTEEVSCNYSGYCMACGFEVGFGGDMEWTCGKFGFYHTCDGNQRAEVQKSTYRYTYDNGKTKEVNSSRVVKELESCS